MDRIFYVYEHYRPDREECFYVGKGHGRRSGKMSERNDYHKRVQAKLKGLGLSVRIVIIARDMTEAEAFVLEAERIAFWRSQGLRLCNYTDGGEGSSGSKHTEEWKQAASARLKGVRRSPEAIAKMKAHIKTEEHRRKISMTNTGRKASDEARRKMSEARKGRSPSPEARAKMSASQKGKIISEETRRKLSMALTGRKMSPESVEKGAAKRRGRKLTPEHIAKLYASFTPERLQNVSKKLKGRPKSEEHRRKIGEAHKGRARPEQHSARISAAWTPERKAAQSERAKIQFALNRERAKA